MKTRTITLGILLMSSWAAGAHAQVIPQIQIQSSQAAVINGIDQNYYYQWCNQAIQILRDASTIARIEYKRLQFAQAKRVIEEGFNHAISATVNGASTGMPGTYRPYTYQALARSIELINLLEGSSAPSLATRDKAIAYVALNQADFVTDVARLDRKYAIRCAFHCRPGYNGDSLLRFENEMVNLVSKELNSAQAYATSDIKDVTFPLVNASFYFTIIGKTAQWAAADLANTNFSTRFSCAISRLDSLGDRAFQLRAIVGDPSSVQIINDEVEKVAGSIDENGCSNGHESYDHELGDAEEDQDADTADQR